MSVEIKTVGEARIAVEYHSTEWIRGWSFRVYGHPSGEISMSDQYGYGSKEEATQTAICVVEELSKERIRHHERRLTAMKELLCESQRLQLQEVGSSA